MTDPALQPAPEAAAVTLDRALATVREEVQRIIERAGVVAAMPPDTALALGLALGAIDRVRDHVARDLRRDRALAQETEAMLRSASFFVPGVKA